MQSTPKSTIILAFARLLFKSNIAYILKTDIYRFVGYHKRLITDFLSYRLVYDQLGFPIMTEVYTNSLSSSRHFRFSAGLRNEA
jgi:hypothetical protein